MRVDRQQTICGMKPAVLKRLLQREAFSTVDAALEFGLSEPALSIAMCDLERGGWISGAAATAISTFGEQQTKGCACARRD